MKPFLTITNLQKSFNKTKIIDGLSLEINEGELIYIHGINGCGKSTLFKIIAGILDKDDGSVQKSENVHIGALIENPGFIENETLKFNLNFLASLTHKDIKDEIYELCQMFSLDYNSKINMKSYSVGMRQKAGIIQAIMEDQNLILLDEPTRGLDSDAIKVLTNTLKKLITSNKTIVIASHDKIDDLNFDKVYAMHNGKLYQE